MVAVREEGGFCFFYQNCLRWADAWSDHAGVAQLLRPAGRRVLLGSVDAGSVLIERPRNVSLRQLGRRLEDALEKSVQGAALLLRVLAGGAR